MIKQTGILEKLLIKYHIYLRTNPNHQFPKVFTLQKSHESFRSIFKSINNIFTIMKFSFLNPFGKLRQGFFFLTGIIPDYEATKSQTFDQNIPHQQRC